MTLAPQEWTGLGTVMQGLSSDRDVAVIVLPEQLRSRKSVYIKCDGECVDEDGEQGFNFSFSDDPEDGFDECPVGQDGAVLFFPPMSEKQLNELAEDRCNALMRAVQAMRPREDRASSS